jgi:hypothetical protein
VRVPALRCCSTPTEKLKLFPTDVYAAGDVELDWR